jgi:hypothetical protein
MNIAFLQQVSKLMGTTVKSMSSAMKGMEVEQIAKTMTEFERQFEDMDVRSGKIRNNCLTSDLPLLLLLHHRQHDFQNLWL